jgi:hypothetical protein
MTIWGKEREGNECVGVIGKKRKEKNKKRKLEEIY